MDPLNADLQQGQMHCNVMSEYENLILLNVYLLQYYHTMCIPDICREHRERRASTNFGLLSNFTNGV